MHGNELTGYVLMLRLIDDLLNGYSNGLYQDVINEIDIWINPLANPDGAYATGDQSVSGATRNNANWVDLNEIIQIHKTDNIQMEMPGKRKHLFL